MSDQRFRILIGGVIISETPEGWEDITSKIKYQRDLKALLITTEATLIFREDGYTNLIARYEDGYCSEVECDLQEWCGGFWETFSQGIIFLSRAVVDRKQCSIKVVVEDNSFYAKINNNKSIEVFPFAEQTKNGITIAAAQLSKMFYFDPATSNYYNILVSSPSYTNAGYRVYDLFDYLIKVISDDTIDFESDLFGLNGSHGGLFLTCGITIRQSLSVGTTEAEFRESFQKLSFKKLLDEVRKKVDIGMYVDYSGTRPKLRIERESDIRTGAVSFTAFDIDELIEKIDQSRLYSSVRLGSTITDDTVYDGVIEPPGLLFPEDISFRGFKEEQFIVLGGCNIDSELNLVSDFIVSHNVIEDILIHGNEDHDDEFVLIMGEIVSGSLQPITYISATQDTIDLDGSGIPPVYYNMELTNQASVQNYLGGIPNSIAQYLGNADQTFRASKTASQTMVQAAYTEITFTDETTAPNQDPGANYDANSRYIIPTGGLYSFYTQIRIYNLTNQHVGGGYEVYLERRDSGGTLIIRFALTTTLLNFGTTQVLNLYKTLTANTGDRIDIAVLKTTGSATGSLRVLQDSVFACTATETGGGIYATFETDDYPVRLHEWEYPLTVDNWKTIERNQTDSIEFSRFDEKHYSGWIDTLTWKRFSTEMAKFITYRAKLIPKPTGEPVELRAVYVYGTLENNSYTFNQVDYYGDPFGGTQTSLHKVFFFPVNRVVTITIPTTVDGHDIGNVNNQSICIVETPSFNTTCIDESINTATFTIQSGVNYIIGLGYDHSTVGNTAFIAQPTITAPAVAGTPGAAGITLVNPTTASDYTFLWNTGETTQLINQPAGTYWVDVTYTPGTFDVNTIRFYIEIPISITGA